MKLIRKIICVALILLMTGCGSAKHYTAYTIYPIGYLLNRIGGNRIEAVSIQNKQLVQCANLVENYDEIVSDSSVLFHIGNLEPYMDLYDDEIKEKGIDLAAGDLSVLNCLYEYKRYTPVVVDGKVSYVEGPYYEGDIFNEIDLSGFLLVACIAWLRMSMSIFPTTMLNNHHISLKTMNR